MDDWTPDRADWLPDPPRQEGAADAGADRQPRPIVGDYRCILFVRNHCPHCGWPRSRIDHVVRTPTRVFRYHRCSQCRQRFKSIETIPPKSP